MKWFLKKKNKSEKLSSKEEADLKFLKALARSQGDQLLQLEKEAVYWKEKALNFRRFHQ